MEKIMSKTIEGELTETECNELVDHELDTVTGGSINLDDILRAIAKVTMIRPASGAASPSVTVNGGPLAFAI
jgi:hypothetical protein